MEKKILDSGERRDFGTGAQRDMASGKGRCDLMPLDMIAELYAMDNQKPIAEILANIDAFMKTGAKQFLLKATYNCITDVFKKTLSEYLLELAKHFEAGCAKYPDKVEGKVTPNMMRGIPVNCYIDSAVRHLIKYAQDMQDEPHDRAFIWNLLMGAWTKTNLKQMDNINYEVFAGKKS